MIKNRGWLPEAFISKIEKHLGKMDVVDKGDGDEPDFVYFGDGYWRGTVYKVDGKIVGVGLIWNGTEKTPAQVQTVEKGLALLTHNDFELPPADPLSQEDIRRRMTDAANAVDERIGGGGFIIVGCFTELSDKGGQPLTQYVSNVHREDAIKMLKELLFRWGKDEAWMQHIR